MKSKKSLAIIVHSYIITHMNQSLKMSSIDTFQPRRQQSGRRHQTFGENINLNFAISASKPAIHMPFLRLIQGSSVHSAKVVVQPPGAVLDCILAQLVRPCCIKNTLLELGNHWTKKQRSAEQNEERKESRTQSHSQNNPRVMERTTRKRSPSSSNGNWNGGGNLGQLLSVSVYSQMSIIFSTASLQIGRTKRTRTESTSVRYGSVLEPNRTDIHGSFKKPNTNRTWGMFRSVRFGEPHSDYFRHGVQENRRNQFQVDSLSQRS